MPITKVLPTTLMAPSLEVRRGAPRSPVPPTTVRRMKRRSGRFVKDILGKPRSIPAARLSFAAVS